MMKKFEDILKEMKEMGTKEREEKIRKITSMCTCPSCPSYNNCAENGKELLFCANGKSFMCISEEKGCTCPRCPVTTEMGLKYKFFCTKGSERAQRYENTIWGTSLLEK